MHLRPLRQAESSRRYQRGGGRELANLAHAIAEAAGFLGRGDLRMAALLASSSRLTRLVAPFS